MSNLDRKKKEAVQNFINQYFEEIPSEMIFSYMNIHGFGSLEDITELTTNINVFCDDGREGEVVAIKGSDDEKTVDVRVWENDEEKILSYPAEEVSRRGWEGRNGMPSWGYMWLLDRNDWIDKVQELSDCGFAVFDCYDEAKLVVGIDGGGYSFTDEHFARLYDTLGMDWHNQLNYDAREIAEAAVKMGAECGLKPDQIAEKLNLSKDFVKAYMPKAMTK